MEFKDIMAIAGKPGLFKFVAQGRNSVIVENLETGKRISAFTTERISSFEEISVFTEDGDVPLAEVFEKMHEKMEGKEAIPPKSAPDKLKTFFREILPGYDEDRVYISDIKKIISWYNQLVSLNAAGELLENRKKQLAEEEKKEAEAKEESEDKTPRKKDEDKTSEKKDERQ